MFKKLIIFSLSIIVYAPTHATDMTSARVAPAPSADYLAELDKIIEAAKFAVASHEWHKSSNTSDGLKLHHSQIEEKVDLDTKVSAELLQVFINEKINDVKFNKKLNVVYVHERNNVRLYELLTSTDSELKKLTKEALIRWYETDLSNELKKICRQKFSSLDQHAQDLDTFARQAASVWLNRRTAQSSCSSCVIS